MSRYEERGSQSPVPIAGDWVKLSDHQATLKERDELADEQDARIERLCDTVRDLILQRGRADQRIAELEEAIQKALDWNVIHPSNDSDEAFSLARTTCVKFHAALTPSGKEGQG